ncbi:MAG TPA: hypothetical protein VFI61_03285 [Patescibacteria group bacterium]|nr:hypothetical protein [Patescibacteria group bacterium]
METKDIGINFGEDIMGVREAFYSSDKGTHLTVRPHTVMQDDGTFKDHGLEVEFWGDKQGKRDPDNLLASNVIPGTGEDLEEVADTYARRLDRGVAPEHMFDDIIENNRKADEDKVVQ